MALGRTILTIIDHVLKHAVPYHELGADLLERLEPEQLTRQLVRRLEKLGHRVSLETQLA